MNAGFRQTILRSSRRRTRIRRNAVCTYAVTILAGLVTGCTADRRADPVVYRLAIVSDGTPLAIPIGVTDPQGGRVPMLSMRLGVAPR